MTERTGVAPRLRQASTRVTRRFKRAIYGPRIRCANRGPLLSLGTEYGGWVFVDSPALRGCRIVSAGLGEDASFDVEFASRYGANVVIVDPTPRAIHHFEQMANRLGTSRSSHYVDGGNQPIEAYDLQNVRDGQLSLISEAITDHVGITRFFAPPNAADVSYSVPNIQNRYSQTTPHIDVPSTTISKIVLDQSIDPLELVKLDIEGSEGDAIRQMLTDGVFPQQILVEFDELNWPSANSKRTFKKTHDLLGQHGYVPTFFDGRSCVSYFHDLETSHRHLASGPGEGA
jgi:FkbM family methyltransferase